MKRIQVTGADKNGKIVFLKERIMGLSFWMKSEMFRQPCRQSFSGSSRNGRSCVSAAIADVRIITATSKNLLKEVETGNFREDLYYRLDVLQLKVPPLRARTEDIGVLLQHLLRENFNHLSKEEKSRLRKLLDELKDEQLVEIHQTRKTTNF